MIRKDRIWFFALLLLLLAGGAGYYFYRTWPQPEPLPTITVEAVYPGACAQVVADTVAAPIEQQVNGVEDIVCMRSQSTGDGRYALHLTFRRGVDLDMARVLVQNRVTLADPILPELVKLHGVSVKKRSPRALLLVVLSSPERKYDDLYLGRYAEIWMRDELARVRGVADIVLVGPQPDSWRVWLDPAKLAARNLTAADVAEAIKQRNEDVLPGTGEQKMQLMLPTMRMDSVEQVENIVVKVDAKGGSVRLKDVGRLEFRGDSQRSQAWLNGQPVAVLAVYPIPQTNVDEVTAAIQEKLGLLRTKLPAGLAVRVAFERTRAWSPEYVRVDLALPEAASEERSAQLVKRCAALVREVPGVQEELTLCGPPFALAENQACILVRLAPASEREASREEVMQTIRATLNKEIPAGTRLCDVSRSLHFPMGGYPIELCILDRGDEGFQAQLQLADKLAERLWQSGKFTDVGVSRGTRPVQQLSMTIDRTAARDRGVAVADIFATLEVFLGSFYVNDFNRFGRAWGVQITSPSRVPIDDIKGLKVRNAQGEMVPLGALVSIRRDERVAAIERLNMYGMVAITANPAAGVSLSEARALCESLADEVRKELGMTSELMSMPDTDN
jgi:multidrug efflux pump subunit AcrB